MGRVIEAEPHQDFRAADLAKLLSNEVFDTEDGAALIGIEKNSLDYAIYRGRIPAVQYGRRRLLTRADLEDYARNRGRGRDSKLRNEKKFVVKEA